MASYGKGAVTHRSPTNEHWCPAPGLDLDKSMVLDSELWNGNGFLRGLSHQNRPVQDLEALAIGDSMMPIPWDLPVVDFLNVPDQAYLRAILDTPLDDDKDRFKKYFSNVPLGLAPLAAVS